MAAIASEQRADRYDEAKQHGLNRPRHEEHRLGMMVPQGRVGDVEERRTSVRAGVQDFENGLEIPVQVHDGTGVSFEFEEFVSIVPPAMRSPTGNPGRFPRACGALPAVDDVGENAGFDIPFLVLDEVNVQRGPLPVRRQRTLQLQPRLPAALDTPHGKDFAGVPIFQYQALSAAIGRHVSLLGSVVQVFRPAGAGGPEGPHDTATKSVLAEGQTGPKRPVVKRSPLVRPDMISKVDAQASAVAPDNNPSARVPRRKSLFTLHVRVAARHERLQPGIVRTPPEVPATVQRHNSEGLEDSGLTTHTKPPCHEPLAAAPRREGRATRCPAPDTPPGPA
jgi:hypothetical protein